MSTFKPSRIETHLDGDRIIRVLIQDKDDAGKRSAILEVDGVMSKANNRYEDIVVQSGYAFATEYWSGLLPRVFKFTEVQEAYSERTKP